MARASLLVLGCWLGGAQALTDGSASFYTSMGANAASNATAKITRLVTAAAKTGAVCLDGSVAAYYHRPGVGSGADKWYIHHEGGGWCESLNDCLARSLGPLGSTINNTDEMELAGAYFDPRPLVNPMMWNWNMVFMVYCDGGSFSGNNDTVTNHLGRSLHFRGKRNLEATYASLLASKSLGSATDVVISGCSAGGLATFLHTDKWCDGLAADAPAAKCVGMPDSGFFLDYQDPRFAQAPSSALGTTAAGRFHSGLRWVFEAMNTSAGMHRDCVRAKGSGGPVSDDPAYLCQFAEHTAPFIHTPIFPLQSEYDSWQMAHVLDHCGPMSKPDRNCTDATVQALGDNITRRIDAALLGPHPQSGVFLDSCYHHCGMWDSIRIDGDLVSTAFAKWYDSLDVPASTRPRPKRAWRQAEKYECVDCCTP